MAYPVTKIRHIAAALSTTMLVACGGGDSTDGGYGNLATIATTATITDKLAALYILESSAVDGAIKTCFSQYGTSGASLSCATNAKTALVLSFTNTALSDIESVQATNTIDKTAVVALLNQYNTTDLLWLNKDTFSSKVTMTSAQVSELAGSYSSKINLYYSNLILRVSSL
jgi:hypothetical protein